MTRMVGVGIEAVLSNSDVLCFSCTHARSSCSKRNLLVNVYPCKCHAMPWLSLQFTHARDPQSSAVIQISIDLIP